MHATRDISSSNDSNRTFIINNNWKKVRSIIKLIPSYNELNSNSVSYEIN